MPSPTPIPGLTGMAEVSAGFSFSLARSASGFVYSWGTNSGCELGDGTQTGRLSPTQVINLDSIVKIAAGGVFGLALKSDGTVWGWGVQNDGELGDGVIGSSCRPNAAQVNGLSNIIQIASGTYHALALRSDGTVWSWGRNSSGQLGDGTIITKATPVPVQGLTNVIAIGAGEFWSFAIKSDGTVWVWGRNYNGSLGNGLASSPLALVPTQIALNVKSNRPIPANDNFTQRIGLSGVSGNEIGFNIGATSESGEPKIDSLSAQHSVWWDWIAPATGQFIISAIGSNFATKFGIFTGSNFSELTPVGVLSEGQITLQAQTGITYRIVVDGTGSATGDTALKWSFSSTPKADTQISLISTASNSGLQYSLTVTNAGPQVATGVVVTLSFPSNFQFQSSNGCTILSPGQAQCTLSILNSGSSKTFTVNVLPTTLGETTAQASVSSDISDNATSNNSVSAPTTITVLPPVQSGAAVSVPALSQWGVLFMGVCLMVIMWRQTQI